jgi:hypothetical protein
MNVWPTYTVMPPGSLLKAGTIFAFIRGSGVALGMVVSKTLVGGAEKKILLLSDPSRSDNDDQSKVSRSF